MSLRNRGYLYLLTLMIPFGLFLGGVLFTLLQSFYLLLPVETADSLGAYKKVLTDPWVYKSFGFSLYIAFMATLLSTIIGFFIAYYIWNWPYKWQRLGSVYKVFLILPHISAAYFVLLFFSQRGILSSLLFQIGWIEDSSAFPLLVFDESGIGIILTYIFKEAPFVALLVMALLKNVPRDLINSARQLGAGKIRIIRQILFPEVKPALQSGFIILFLYSFGAFEVPFLLGSSRPEMLSVLAYNLYYRKDLSSRPEAMVILVFILLFSLLFMIIFFFLRRSLAEKERIL